MSKCCKKIQKFFGAKTKKRSRRGEESDAYITDANQEDATKKGGKTQNKPVITMKHPKPARGRS